MLWSKAQTVLGVLPLFVFNCVESPETMQIQQPEGYVLLDDFENKFRAQPGLNDLGAAEQFSERVTYTRSGWYVFGNDSTRITSFDGSTIFRWEEWYKQGLPNNGYIAIGPYGSSMNGLFCRILLKSTGMDYAYAGCGTSLIGNYYEKKIDLSALTTVTFEARGKGIFRLQIVTDTIDQGYPPEDQWGHFGIDFELTDEWKHYTCPTSEFKPMSYSRARKEGLQWSTACVKSTFLEFITSQDYGQHVNDTLEIAVDDIRLYGVTYEETFGFRYGIR
jgi:hypothetical protein